MRYMVLVAAMLLLLPACADETPDKLTTDQFEWEGHSMPYALYAPAAPAENLPMIVFLHGSHGRGDDISRAIDHGFPRFLAKGELGVVPAWVLVPQLPEQAEGWYQYEAQVIALIQAVCEQTHADTSRISLTGHSMGGIGTWDLAMLHPDMFCCIAPISGKLTATEEQLQILSMFPTRAFVGDADIKELLQKNHLALMDALDALNSDFEFAIVEHANHSQVAQRVYTAFSSADEAEAQAMAEMPALLVWLLSHSAP